MYLFSSFSFLLLCPFTLPFSYHFNITTILIWFLDPYFTHFLNGHFSPLSFLSVFRTLLHELPPPSPFLFPSSLLIFSLFKVCLTIAINIIIFSYPFWVLIQTISCHQTIFSSFMKFPRESFLVSSLVLQSLISPRLSLFPLPFRFLSYYNIVLNLISISELSIPPFSPQPPDTKFPLKGFLPIWPFPCPFFISVLWNFNWFNCHF